MASNSGHRILRCRGPGSLALGSSKYRHPSVCLEKRTWQIMKCRAPDKRYHAIGFGATLPVLGNSRASRRADYRTATSRRLSRRMNIHGIVNRGEVRCRALRKVRPNCHRSFQALRFQSKRASSSGSTTYLIEDLENSSLCIHLPSPDG